MIIRENVNLSELTTMRLGGPADFVIEAETPEEALEALEFAESKNLPVYFLGAGANSIGLDSGFPGVILINKIKGYKILSESSSELIVEVGGGEKWDDFVKFVCEKGFSGVEALSKIPGTVAAAPVQNIGAYGQDVSETLERVDVFDTLLNEFSEFVNKDLDFSYRHSIFNSGDTKGRYFILSCVFRFTQKTLTPPFYNSLQVYLDSHNISDYSPQNIRAAVSAIRAEKLPDPESIPSAGSFFKNIYLSAPEAEKAKNSGIPVRETVLANGETEYKVNTGWLLEQANLSGKNFHGFELYDKAMLVLTNRSATKESDLELAVQEISDIVKSKFGFALEIEPVKIQETLDD